MLLIGTAILKNNHIIRFNKYNLLNDLCKEINA